MKDYALHDDLVAKKISKDNVSDRNTTLCITNNHLKIDFDQNSWDGIANKMITGYRKKSKGQSDTK